MPLFLGSGEKVKIHQQNNTTILDIYTIKPITNGDRLLSDENYILKDSKGTYLTAKKGDGE